MTNFVKSAYNDFFDFLRKPKDQQDSVQSNRRKASMLFLLLLLDVAVSSIILVFINQLIKAGLVNTDKNKLETLFQSIPVWSFLLLSILIIPFFEELVFRHYLRFNQNILVRFIIWLFSLTGKGKGKKINDKLNRYWNKKFLIIFYFSAIIFGLAHISNYNSSATIFYLFPVLVLPQFFVGIFTGYLRVRYNFFVGYFLHALHNAVFIIISIMLSAGAITKMNLRTDAYSLKIEQLNSGNANASSTIGADTISFQNNDLKSILSSLTGKSATLIASNDTNKLETKLNLQFFTILPSATQDNKRIILNNLSKVYGFTVEQRSRNQGIYQLKVADVEKLSGSLSDSDDNSSNITETKNELILKNATLRELVSVISSNYHTYTACDTLNNRKFNFILPNNDFQRLKDKLQMDYGISIVDTKKKVAYIYIKFSNPK